MGAALCNMRMHLTSIVVSPSSSKQVSKPLASTSSNHFETPTLGIHFENRNKQVRPVDSKQQQLKMALLYGAALAFLLLLGVGILMGEARVLARHDDGGDYPAAAIDADSGGYANSGSDGSNVHFRSAAQPKDDIPPEFRAKLPPEIRNKPASELKPLVAGMLEALKTCTVSELNLAELSGTWMLASLATKLPKQEKVIVNFKNDQPGHLSGTLKPADQQARKLNFTQFPELPGALIHIEMTDDKLAFAPLYIVVHKRHRFFVTMTVLSDGQPDYGIWVRVHHKPPGKKPKPPTQAELAQAKAGVSCFFKGPPGTRGAKDTPEAPFYKVL